MKINCVIIVLKIRSDLIAYIGWGLQEKLLFILYFISLTIFIDSFVPRCFRPCPTPSFNVKLMRVCSYVCNIFFFIKLATGERLF